MAIGRGWRLPTDDEWRGLSRRYGGLMDDSERGARAAYQSLIEGGSAQFGALHGGNHEAQGSKYSRLDAHGGAGDKRMATRVRCHSRTDEGAIAWMV